VIRRFATVAGMLTLDGTFWFFLAFLIAFRLLGVGGNSLTESVGLTLGGAFGAALFVALGTALIDLVFVAPILNETGGRIPRLIESRQLTIYASAAETLGAIERACRDNGLRIREKDLAEGRVRASKGFSFITSGEAVTFEMLELDEATTELTLTSRPRSPFAYTDFGRNYRNVEAIANHLMGQGIRGKV